MTKMKIGGIEVEVMSEEAIAASACPIVSVPLKKALQPIENNYPAGTKNGFACSVCEQDCILAPSGQKQFSLGKNPIICFDCFIKSMEPAQA